MTDHPLLPDASQAIPLYRRPRFTTGEAIILNALVNAEGQPVSISALVRAVRVGAFQVKPATVQAHLYHIRAKLGEVKNNPVRIRRSRVLENGYWISAYSYHDGGEHG